MTEPTSTTNFGNSAWFPLIGDYVLDFIALIVFTLLLAVFAAGAIFQAGIVAISLIYALSKFAYIQRYGSHPAFNGLWPFYTERTFRNCVFIVTHFCACRIRHCANKWPRGHIQLRSTACGRFIPKIEYHHCDSTQE